MTDNMPMTSLFEDVSKKVDEILAGLPKEGISQEALNSNFLGRFFVSIVDTFTGLCRTFESNLVNINKSIKRSELHEFIDSNRLKVRTVDAIPMVRLVGFQVDVPANLQGTYKNAISNIAQIYIRLNVLNTGKLVQTSLTNIFNSLVNEEKKSGALIRSTASVVDQTIRASKQTVLDCQRNFSGKFEQKVPFESIFRTKEEWIDCQRMLRDLEPRLQEARSIQELVTHMEQTLKSVCDHLTDTNDNLNQNDLMMFGEMVKNVALVMDGYNLAIMRQLALEHNYVLMINAIYSGVK